jgi:[ribosomal protein S5]-alanine N-acetyltransferase
MDSLFTPRLELRPITLPIVLAVLEGRRRSDIEAMIGAEMPWTWPSRQLVEQVFQASLEAVRADPDKRLWGDRLMVTREGPPAVVGSIIFDGRPGPSGTCSIGYGVEEANQRKGYATEALRATLDWAFAQPECQRIRATTSAWHQGSIRVLEKIGMRLVAEQEDAEGDGRILVYEIGRAQVG